jgi:hypothetical protein
MMNPAIVVNAYNRPHSLARLLRSIGSARYPDRFQVPLVISLDDAGRHPEVEAVARQFSWVWGSKEILCREEPLGLLKHFYACGDLAKEYGAMIYLEDDLLVSPVFYLYASQALGFYQNDPLIAGISLYNLWFNGYTHEPFIPYLDEADIFFVQVPYTQGEAFTADQWAGFRSWQANPSSHQSSAYPLHESWFHFQPDDWFPDWTRYMVSTGRFYVYPRASLSAGSGDAGTHFSQASSFFQVPLQYEKTTYQLKSLNDSLAVYDSFFEILPDRLNRQTDLLNGFEYTVDLNATRSKANLPTEWVLTTRQSRRPRLAFGKTMWPIEANVVHQIPGEGINFCRKEDLLWGRWAELQTWSSNRLYFLRGRHLGIRDWLKMKLAIALIRARESFKIGTGDTR